MRCRIALEGEARTHLRNLAPGPKRVIREALREMAEDPYGPDTIRLERPEIRYRVRVGDYRIVFRPGPGQREVTVTQIGHRDSVYEGLERSSEDA